MVLSGNMQSHPRKNKLYFLGGNGLVACIHNRQVLDVLETSDGDSSLHPAGFPVGEIVPSVGILVDGVGGIWVMGLDNLPGPSPGEIGQLTFLLRVLVAVYGIEHAENRFFLHIGLVLKVFTNRAALELRTALQKSKRVVMS